MAGWWRVPEVRARGKHAMDFVFGELYSCKQPGGLWEVSHAPDPEFHVAHLGLLFSYHTRLL